MPTGPQPARPPQAGDAARPDSTRTLLVLGSAGMAYAMGQTTLFPALSELIRALHTDAGSVAWTFSGYMVSAAVLTPVFGRLGDMFGKRVILVLALVLFTVGNVISALGDTLVIVVLGRVVQGASVGVFPLAFGVIRDEFPPERVRTGVGVISGTVGVGSGVGLVVGGLLVDHADYHWIFWASAMVGAVSAVACRLYIPESLVRRPAPVDIRGAVVMAVGLVLPLVAISEAKTWGWASPRTLGLIAAGAVVLAGWVVLERATEHPLVNMRTLGQPPVLATNVVTILIGFGMFGSYVLVPQLAQAPSSGGFGFGDDATIAGLLLVPGSLLMLVTGPVSGMIGARFGSRIPLAVGGVINGAGMLALAWSHGSYLLVLVLTSVALTGVGLGYAALPNLIIDAVPRSETGEATGVNTVMRGIGAALGGQVVATILAGSAAAGSTAPAESGFRTAFVVGATMALVGAGFALLIPRARGAPGEHLDVLGEIGAAAPLGEPPYVPD
ncbi:MFS transporter [Baekduia soli]|uniref:MFS transporter n=1 Tax=Baekduia soli TaxID=496014 RepID=UPI001651BA11|nr:MFS transporter [Baekduia soli]